MVLGDRGYRSFYQELHMLTYEHKWHTGGRIKHTLQSLIAVDRNVISKHDNSRAQLYREGVNERKCFTSAVTCARYRPLA